MRQLTSIQVTDLRLQVRAAAVKMLGSEEFLRRKAEMGTFKKTEITLHYAGVDYDPARVDTSAEMLHVIVNGYLPRHITHIGDALVAYHFIVLDTGEILQTRDIGDQSYHSAGAANRSGVAVHLPLGPHQTPSPAQWEATLRLFSALMTELGIKSRQSVKGHTEVPKFIKRNGRFVRVPNSECPGIILMGMLRQWRDQPQPVRVEQPTPTTRRFRAVRDGIRVRTEPTKESEQARMNGELVSIGLGNEFDIKESKQGEEIEGNAQWLHIGEIGWAAAAYFEEVRKNV